MELMDGTLTSLLKGGPDRKVAETVYHHILQALDFLATKSIVHLDVKPDNIFYTRTPGTPGTPGHYHFRLGDLGLSGGTPLYMAPELFLDMPQTHKSDVWSLYVTMLWTADFCDFRESSMEFRNQSEVLDEVLRLASEPGPDRIAEMGRKDPEKRASAAQMLVKHFYGDGLTTHKKKVPPLKDVNGGNHLTTLPPVPRFDDTFISAMGCANNGLPGALNIPTADVATIAPRTKQSATRPRTPGNGVTKRTKVYASSVAATKRARIIRDDLMELDIFPP